MRIELKCFATLAQYVPPGDDPREVPDNLTVAGLMAHFKLPAEEVKLIFVNGKRVEPDHLLADGDRVGLFPPVGGG